MILYWCIGLSIISYSIQSHSLCAVRCVYVINVHTFSSQRLGGVPYLVGYPNLYICIHGKMSGLAYGSIVLLLLLWDSSAARKIRFIYFKIFG